MPIFFSFAGCLLSRTFRRIPRGRPALAPMQTWKHAFDPYLAYEAAFLGVVTVPTLRRYVAHDQLRLHPGLPSRTSAGNALPSGPVGRSPELRGLAGVLRTPGSSSGAAAASAVDPAGRENARTKAAPRTSNPALTSEATLVLFPVLSQSSNRRTGADRDGRHRLPRSIKSGCLTGWTPGRASR
jgi:hypothetical protein